MNLPTYEYRKQEIECYAFDNSANDIASRGGPYEDIGELFLPTTAAITQMKVGQKFFIAALPNLLRKLRRTCYDSRDAIGGDMAFCVGQSRLDSELLSVHAYKLPLNSYYSIIRDEFYQFINQMRRDVVYYIGCHDKETLFLVSYLAELWNKENKTDYISEAACTPGGNDHTWQFKKPSPDKRPMAVQDRIFAHESKEMKKQQEKLNAMEATIATAPQVKEWAAKPYHSLSVGESCVLQPHEYTKPLSLRQTVYAFSRRKGITMKVTINADQSATITRIQ